MKLIYTYIPFQVLLGVLFGILFPINNTLVLGLSFGLLMLLFVVLIVLNKKKSRFGNTSLFFVFIVLFGCCASWCSQFLNNDLNVKNHYRHQNFGKENIELTLSQKIKSSKKYFRFYANVNAIHHQKSYGKILVEIPKNAKDSLQIGDQLLCKSNINNINLPTSPYDFNYRSYLENKDVYGKIRLENYLLKGTSISVLMRIQRFRNRIVEQLQKAKISENTKGLMMAMLLGDRESISDEMQTSFTDAGVVHLIAISGMHVGVLYLLLLFTFGFLKRIKYGNYVYVFLVLTCLWCFAIFSGLSSSVVRCVTMFSFISVSKLVYRKNLLLEPIISSMLVLLLVKPNFLLDVGFQLSYAAVISIVVFYPLLAKRINLKNKIAKYFMDVLLVSIIAQLGVLPLSLYYFHQFPFQFLIANFFAVSLLPLVLYGGLIVLLKLLFVNSLFWVEKAFDTFIIFYLNIIQQLSAIDTLIVREVFFSVSYIMCYYLVALGLWLWMSTSKSRNFALFLGTIVIFQLTCLYQNYQAVQKEELLIYNNYTSLITLRKGTKLYVIGKDSLTARDCFNLTSNKVRNQTKDTKIIENKIFKYRENRYLVVSQKNLKSVVKESNMILIITENPKVNFERLLKEIQPKKVVIDASNYANNVLKWKSTCKKLQVPSYVIAEKGAFIIP
ncbi:ComEC/Rec2 family competence protein [Wenyingzhuangia sp. 2_MG-2023]|uniref:ComEC/Rec2 family competence protein n=1 Tax=Wenyingzhuangia sp. 2_MG-2023 TaxID=3062639 RepID=UPI0026E19847|nr:ComEC/Rec2 family competence protein [Wenyingzhuangia sp. 2_MG-2023]MDO6738237.1 ComEC/Rec2 family competence protein [Wenyingzhuangia sp. 2_MG-2023]